MSLLDDDRLDVVGCELEEARRILEAAELTVRLERVGQMRPGEDPPPLRVIRQARYGQTVALTCAPEDWGTDRAAAE